MHCTWHFVVGRLNEVPVITNVDLLRGGVFYDGTPKLSYVVICLLVLS